MRIYQLLQMAHYYRADILRDLVRRPHTSIDVVPFFRLDDAVLARMSYPRPVLASRHASPAIDECGAPYVTEPRPLCKLTSRSAKRSKRCSWRTRRCQVTLSSIFQEARTTPLPVGRAKSPLVFVDIDPVFVEEEISNVSGFGTSGRIRHSRPNRFYERPRSVVFRMRDLNSRLRSVSRYGEIWPVAQRDHADPRGTAMSNCTSISRCLRACLAGRFGRRPRRLLRSFSICDVGFERDQRRVCRRRVVSMLLRSSEHEHDGLRAARRFDGDLWMGIDDDDLPAAQCFVGNSELLVTSRGGFRGR